MKMEHEPGNAAMWHTDCPESRWRSGVMRPVKGLRSILSDCKQRLWECMHCGERGWYGVDSDGVIHVHEADKEQK